MTKKIREHIAMLETNWRPFLEKLADTVHPRDPSNPDRPDWTPEDESWWQLVNYLDGVTVAYVAWQSEGLTVNEHASPVDDARILELIEPCGLSEADRRVFVLTCQQLVQDRRKLYPKIPNESEDDAPE
jgi:hypothetical protein